MIYYFTVFLESQLLECNRFLTIFTFTIFTFTIFLQYVIALCVKYTKYLKIGF